MTVVNIPDLEVPSLPQSNDFLLKWIFLFTTIDLTVLEFKYDKINP